MARRRWRMKRESGAPTRSYENLNPSRKSRRLFRGCSNRGPDVPLAQPKICRFLTFLLSSAVQTVRLDSLCRPSELNVLLRLFFSIVRRVAASALEIVDCVSRVKKVGRRVAAINTIVKDP